MCMHIHEGILSRREFSIDLGQGSTEPKLYLVKVRRVNNVIASSTWGGALGPAELKGVFLCGSPSGETRTLCCLTATSLFFHFLVPFRSVITEIYSRASIVAKLRSQNGLEQDGFSYVKKAIPGSHSPDQIRSDQSLSHVRLFATP